MRSRSVDAGVNLGCIAILVLATAGSVPASAVTQDNFQLRTGTDLVELCSATQDDPLQMAALHMCHGFGVGCYQTLVAVTSSDKVDDFFCPPNPPHSRNEAFAKFLAWAKLSQNAPYLSESPAALIGRYLVTTHPCPKPAAKVGGR